MATLSGQRWSTFGERRRPLDGCTILFPNGHYWVQHQGTNTYALELPQTGPHSFVRFAGVGFAGDRAVSGGGITPSQANQANSTTSELVSADPTTPIMTVGMNPASSMNAGPQFERMGFRDVSGVCASPGGLLFQNVTRSRLQDVGFREFCNGYAVKYDGLGSGVNQFNYLENLTAIDDKNGIVFTGGANFDNWVEFGTFYHSQTGGGMCVDFQGNQGLGSGGTNFVMSGSCNFFPIAVHMVDQHAEFISTKAENTAGNGPMNNNTVGGLSMTGTWQSGVGIQVDASPNGNCVQNRLISPVLAWFDTFLSISANCSSDLVIVPSYSSNGYIGELHRGPGQRHRRHPPGSQRIVPRIRYPFQSNHGQRSRNRLNEQPDNLRYSICNSRTYLCRQFIE